MNNAADIVETTRVRLARNFEDTPFSQAMNAAQAKHNRDRVRALLGEEYTCIDMNQIDQIQRGSLVESHLMSRELTSSDWGALLINKSRTISIMLGEEDHIRIQCILPGLALSKADEMTSQVENRISAEGFAFDEELGYLTSCPTNVGTGMRASVMLHLPALTKTEAMQGLLETVGKFGFAMRGFYGEGTSALGCMYQLSNQVTLGVSEEEVLQSLEQAVHSIVEKERMVRAALMQAHGLELTDIVLRALGTLKYSRVMESSEMMKHISNVKLGLGLGLVAGIAAGDIRELISKTQPATLQMKLGPDASAQARDAERANIMRKAFARCEASQQIDTDIEK